MHALAHNTKDSMFDWLGKNPEKTRRFGSAMSTLVPEGHAATFLSSAFDWAALGKSTVVDVGGSTGGVSVMLAQGFKDLEFVVQDLPEAITGAEEKVLLEVKERISFMAHDSFAPQPIVAPTYLLRAVLHNWPDRYCVDILRSLVPALRHGARVVVNDILVPEPGTLDLLSERSIR